MVSGHGQMAAAARLRTAAQRPDAWVAGARSDPLVPTASPPEMAMSLRTSSYLLNTLLADQDLAAEDTGWAMRQEIAGDADPVSLAGFLVALRAKGKTVQELAGPGGRHLGRGGPRPGRRRRGRHRRRPGTYREHLDYGGDRDRRGRRARDQARRPVGVQFLVLVTSMSLALIVKAFRTRRPKASASSAWSA